MNNHDKNRIELYLTAVFNDLDTYLDNPHEFDSEYFEDIREAVSECLTLLQKKEAA